MLYENQKLKAIIMFTSIDNLPTKEAISNILNKLKEKCIREVAEKVPLIMRDSQLSISRRKQVIYSIEYWWGVNIFRVYDYSIKNDNPPCVNQSSSIDIVAEFLFQNIRKLPK